MPQVPTEAPAGALLAIKVTDLPLTRELLNDPSSQASVCLCFGHQGPPTQDSVVTLLSIFRSLIVGGLQGVCSGIFLERNLLTFQFCLVPGHFGITRSLAGTLDRHAPPSLHGFGRGRSLSHKRRCHYPVGSRVPSFFLSSCLLCWVLFCGEQCGG